MKFGVWKSLVGASLAVALCTSLGCPAGDTTGGGGNGGGPAPSGNGGEPDTGNGGAAATNGSGTAPVEIKEGWGHLKGRFTISGAPEAKKVDVTKDVQFCGKFEIFDETFDVGDGSGLANVVVLLYTKRGEDPPEPHESYNETAEASVVLDNNQCVFVPHVQLLRTTQTLEVKNSDTVAHNTKIEYQPKPINPILPPGQTITEQFTQAERLPARVSCSIHPWMGAWLVVKDTPYMTVSNENGEFTIENLPSGEWTFQFWHEALGYVSKVNVGGADTEWSRGRTELVINGDETNDLGEIKIDHAAY